MNHQVIVIQAGEERSLAKSPISSKTSGPLLVALKYWPRAQKAFDRRLPPVGCLTVREVSTTYDETRRSNATSDERRGFRHSLSAVAAYGSVGPGRPARGTEPHHAGSHFGGGERDSARAHGATRCRDRDRGDARQPGPVRA